MNRIGEGNRCPTLSAKYAERMGYPLYPLSIRICATFLSLEKSMNFVPRLGVWFRFTEDELLNEIRRVITANNGVVPRPSIFEKLSSMQVRTIQARFGSYDKAISRAGYAYVRNDVKYVRNDVESDLRKVLAITDGHKFSHEFYKKSGGLYADKTIKKILKMSNWDAVMEAIGAQQRPYVVRMTSYGIRRKELANLTNDNLLDEIGRIWRSKGSRPKYREFHQTSALGIRVFERRFGSWSNAISAYCKRERVALQASPGTRSTNEILLAELRSIRRNRPNDLLTYDFYRINGGTYSIGTFQAHFGSWTAAVREVDATSGKSRKYTADQLFDEIQRLWEKLGRQPSSNEMAQKGTISPGAYRRVFGGWTKAIIAFCDDRNSEDETLTSEEAVKIDSAFCDGTVVPTLDRVAVVAISLVPPIGAGVNIILKKTPRRPSNRLRFKVLNRDHFQCQVCGRSQEKDGVGVEVDHIEPYSKDGETVLENLWTLCRDCNQGKSDSRIN
jgi:hypothetical protein